MPRSYFSDTATKKRLADALIALLKEKPFAAITVTEIARRAGVSRMMYYRHYASKEAILDERVEEISRDFLSIVANAGSKYQSVVSGFGRVLDYREALQVLMKANMGSVLLRVVTDHMVETFCKDESGARRRYLIPLYVGALYNVYLAWLENGAKESPEEMARMVCGAFSIPVEPQ